jgi:hypothetical protein
MTSGMYMARDPVTAQAASEGMHHASHISDSEKSARAGTYRDCRTYVVNALATGRYDILRPCEGACKDGYMMFEVVDIVNLVKEIMHVRESTLKGKLLVSIREAHRQAMQYLLSAVCKKPVAARNSMAFAHLATQLNGRLLTYAHDKKQRRAWEAFKEFLKR